LNSKNSYEVAIDAKYTFRQKLNDYLVLTKFRLGTIVVVSSLLGYGIVSKGTGNWKDVLLLAIGGYLVTGAANALNQVLEKDFDAMMDRTADRPIATGRMKSSEGVMFAGLSCLLGISILAMFNPVTALLGMLSMVLYAFVYTPMKRYSTLSVAVGAIPGALPVMIGATAFDGRITLIALCLFIIQFLWQFPHFWAIGYLSFADYKNAGFKLLPDQNGQIDRNLGLSSTIYAVMIFPIILYLYFSFETSLISFLIALLLTIGYSVVAYIFHMDFDRPSARRLMFYSFIYLPAILIAYWIF
jgi:heme o synthase